MNKRASFGNHVPKTFDDPERLPISEQEAAQWQAANATFWQDNPMRYDWRESVGHAEGTKEFFEEIDRRFLEEIRYVMPWKKIPFDNLVPFDELKDMRVLEIGVGMGTHAGLIAPRALHYTGIDVTEKAVGLTGQRMRGMGVDADIRQMDAERLDFPDAAFDFVWSWGVIHHTSNTRKVVQEIHRVLKPRGRAVIMVYHRGWWNYYTVGTLAHGVLRGGFFKHGSLARVVQANTDGALARYYSRASFKRMVMPPFVADEMFITGNKSDVLPMPGGRLKTAILRAIPNPLARCLLGPLSMGSLLVARLRKA